MFGTCLGFRGSFWTCFGHVLDMFRHVLDMFGTCVGHVLDMFWTCFGHVLYKFRTCFGQVLDNKLDTIWPIFEPYFGHVFAKVLLN